MPSDEKEVGLDFVVKISERCNLACPYCYYYFQDFDSSSYARYISLPVVEQLGSFIAEGANQLGFDLVRIGLHGGEPLLLKKTYFDEICTRLASKLDGHVKFGFGLQTNGTLIDDEWIDLFSKHHVRAGVSIDGPKYHHDKVRPDKRGRGSYDKAARGLALLKRAFDEGRLETVGALCVADPNLSAHEIFRHFYEDLDLGGFSLLLPRSGWDSDLGKKQAEWKQYFSEAIDYWLKHLAKGDVSYNRILSDVLFAMLSDEAAEMNDWRKSMRHHVITISSEGHLAPDDNLISVDSQYADTGMTIFNSSLQQFMSSPIWLSLINAIDTVPIECIDCEWYRSCRSGELFNRISKSDGLKQRTVFCETMDYIHLKIAKFMVHNGIKLDDLATRLGTPPKTRATDFTTEALIHRRNERTA